MIESPLVRILQSALLLGVLVCAAAPSAETAPPPSKEETSTDQALQEKLDVLERLDRELQEAKAQLSTTPTPLDRRRIQAYIKELTATQEKLLDELEKLAGPLPPTVRTQPTTPSEQQLDSHQKRHEVTLESNAQKRSRSN